MPHRIAINHLNDDARDGRASTDRAEASPARDVARIAALVLAITAGAANAGYITQPEPALDRIFGQASFGAQRVDVRFNARQTLYSSALARVDSSGDLNALFGRATSATTLYAFYVDTVDWCGGYATAIIGCGEWPGNAVVLESSWAASSYGAALIAHEAGHNLGLGHVSTRANLMYGALTGATALTTTQAGRILASPLVQWRDGLRTLSITPIAVVAGSAGAASAGPTGSAGGATVNAVAEPASGALAVLALALAVCGAGRVLKSEG
jgi:hypothetical protein